MAIYIYPAQSVNASNPSVGTNNTSAPGSSTQVAGNDAGTLVPLSVNSAGELALPQGAATSAAQTDGSQKTQIVDGAGNVIGSTSNALNVAITSGGGSATGTVDANNSTTTPLGIAGVFTGAATDIKDYGTVSVLVASDVAAASGGFSFQFSNNGTNWDHVHNFDFAGGNLSYNISAEARYFRLVYTNGAVAQSYFRLQTVLRPVNVMPSQYTIAQPVSDYNLSTVTKGVIYGKTTGGGGGYVAVKVNPSGALTTENTVVSSVLPTGAATETTLSTRASETTLSSLNSKVPANLTVSSTRLLVDNSGVTQPISASNLPLPTGAATETTLDAIKTSVQLLDDVVSGNELQVDVITSALPTGAATETTLQSIEADTTALAGTVSSGKLLVDGSSVTQPVSASSLPLPTGAATETTLSSLDTKVVTTANGIKVDNSAVTQPISAASLPLPAGAATETTLLSIEADTTALANTISSGKLLVDGSSVTQPVSAASLPLPTGAATSAAQTDGSQKSQLVNSSGTSATLTGTALDVNIASGSITATNSANGNTGSTVPTQATQVAGSDSGTLRAIKVNASGVVAVDGSATTQPISASSLPLPTGAATSAAQTDGTQKSQIVSSGGTSVSLTGTYLDVNLASGSVTATNSANGNTGSAVPVQATQIAGSDSGTLRAVKVSSTGIVSVDGSSVTQPVSATSLPLPTGAATETTLQSIEADTTTLAGTVSSGKILVDGSGVTQPISASSLPLPTGAATETTLSALNQRLGGSLTPVRFDEIALTYVSSGNGAGEIQTAVFKLATVTVRTLTLSYDSSNRLTGVVAT